MPDDGGMLCRGPIVPPAPKVGRPPRNRSKNKAQRAARKRRR